MATTKARLNISLSRDVRDVLASVARRDRVPQATKAARLLETALELEEDQVWDALVAVRDKKKAHYIPHRKAWK